MYIKYPEHISDSSHRQPRVTRRGGQYNLIRPSLSNYTIPALKYAKICRNFSINQMMNCNKSINFAVLFVIISLTGYSGSTESTTGTRQASQLRAKSCDIYSSYSISWDRVQGNDERLGGFRLYYGYSPSLNKNNAFSYITLGTGSYATIFIPANYNITDCSNAYIEISATGSQAESSLDVIKL